MIVNNEDSLFVIIDDVISESLNKSFDELNIRLGPLIENGEEIQIISEMEENNINLEPKHFKNVHLFNVDNLQIIFWKKHQILTSHKSLTVKGKI